MSRAQFAEIIQANRGKYAYKADSLAVAGFCHIVNNPEVYRQPQGVRGRFTPSRSTIKQAADIRKAADMSGVVNALDRGFIPNPASASEDSYGNCH